MSGAGRSLPQEYFDRLYAQDPDPWRFATSSYEQNKYQATLNALPRVQYQSALEIGCSIGILTERLATRCAALLAIDIAERALGQARTRCAGLDHVRFELGSVPDHWPVGTFDLILLSEVLYYLDEVDLDKLTDRVKRALRQGGDIVLVHWIGDTDYPLTGNEAVDRFIRSAAVFARPVRQMREVSYRLDVLHAS